MKIGAIGDIHAEHVFLEVALRFLAARSPDCLLATGDLVDGRGDADRCIELLEAYEVEAVRGNHDRWFTDDQMRDLAGATLDLAEPNRSYVESLPIMRTYETPAGPLLLCHGLEDHDMGEVTDDDHGYALETNDELHALLEHGRYRYVINGHSHRRMVRRFATTTIINVGTLLWRHNPCFAWIDFEEKQVEFFDLGSDGEIVPAQPVAFP